MAQSLSWGSQVVVKKIDPHSLSFIVSYLNEKKQRRKIHNYYNPFTHIACRVLQGSILVPLPFNINICNMFEKYKCDIARDVDDNTPHT